MRKIITIILSIIFLVGCSSTKEQVIDDKEKSNIVNSIENNSDSLKIDSNWNIPVKGQISGVFCGFMDNHSFELLGEDGNYYAISILKFMDKDFDDLESNKTKLTLEYKIEEEGSQLTLIKILDKN